MNRIISTPPRRVLKTIAPTVEALDRALDRFFSSAKAGLERVEPACGFGLSFGENAVTFDVRGGRPGRAPVEPAWRAGRTVAEIRAANEEGRGRLWSTVEALNSSSDAPEDAGDDDAGVIRGYVVAEDGVFKSRRGQFTPKSLRRIVSLMEAYPDGGLRSYFTHHGYDDDEDHRTGTFLGRLKNPRLDSTGRRLTVLADLHLDPSAHCTPNGDLARYVLTLAASDPSAISTSLVSSDDVVCARDYRGRPTSGPLVWIPVQLYSSDVVDTGDAVGGLLGKGGMATHDPTVVRW